jgi:hypothetical protein
MDGITAVFTPFPFTLHANMQTPGARCPGSDPRGLRIITSVLQWFTGGGTAKEFALFPKTVNTRHPALPASKIVALHDNRIGRTEG